MWAISGGSSAPPAETERPPNIRWSTNRSSRPSAAPSSAIRTRRWRSGAESGGWTQELAAHAEVAEQCVAVVEGQPEVLAPATGVLDAPAGQRGREPSRTARVAAYGTGVQHLDRGDDGAEHVAGQPGADHLDLGQLRHGDSRSRSRSGVRGLLDRVLQRVGDAEAAGDRAVRRLGGGLLGFLLGPADAVAVELVGDPHLGGEGLLVVGALVLDDVLRDAEGVLGGELLEGGLPVQARAERGGRLDERVEEPVHRPRTTPRCRR